MRPARRSHALTGARSPGRILLSEPADPAAREEMCAFRRIALKPKAIADAVLHAVSRPDDVDTTEVVVRPVASPH